MSVSLGLSLRRARLKYAVDIASLAKMSGFQVDELMNVEAGLREASDELLKAYAERFRLEFSELVRARGK